RRALETAGAMPVICAIGLAPSDTLLIGPRRNDRITAGAETDQAESMRFDTQVITRNRHWQRLRRNGPGLLLLLLLAGAAWHAASLTWSVVEVAGTELVLPPPAPMDPRYRAERSDRAPMQQIADLHLFGRADAPRDDLAAVAAEAPET